MKDWRRAESKVRESDFEAAAEALLGPGRALGLDAFFKNTPSHDLMYSTPPRGAKVSPSELKSWKSAAARRSSAALWTLSAAAEMAMGRSTRACATLTRALALDPGLEAARLVRAAVRLVLSRERRDNSFLPGCLDDLDRVLAADPENPRALRLRAELSNDCEDFEGARRDLEKALALEPDNGWARAELADLLCDSGQFGQAWAVMKSLEPSGRGQGWYWALRGRALAVSGKAAQGLKDLDQAVKLDPRLASAIGWRGEAHRRLGRYREALRDLDRSIAMDPGFVYAYEWRARLLLMLGRVPEALADADVIVRRDRRHRYGPMLRGEALFKLGRFARAAADFDRAYPLDPQRAWNPRVREGHLTTPAEREKAFWEDIQQALLSFPREAAAWTLSGRFKSVSGRKAQAVADLTQAAALAKAARSKASALSWRARALLDSGSPERALADLDVALRLDPRDRRARCWKAEALTALGRSGRALSEYGKALKEPRFGPAFGFLARAALRKEAGRWDEARDDYAAAFALDVKSRAARLGLAECRRRLGER